MNTETRELKPCPFCGKSDELKREVEAGCWVECQRCMAAGPACETVEAGDEAWNRRSLPTNPDLERIADELEALVGDPVKPFDHIVATVDKATAALRQLAQADRQPPQSDEGLREAVEGLLARMTRGHGGGNASWVVSQLRAILASHESPLRREVEETVTFDNLPNMSRESLEWHYKTACLNWEEMITQRDKLFDAMKSIYDMTGATSAKDAVKEIRVTCEATMYPVEPASQPNSQGEV